MKLDTNGARNQTTQNMTLGLFYVTVTFMEDKDSED